MSKLAFTAQTVDIAYLPLRQDFFAKNVLMTAQRDFRLDNSPLSSVSSWWLLVAGCEKQPRNMQVFNGRRKRSGI